MIKIADSTYTSVRRAAPALAALCLPDPSVIDVSEDARECAKGVLQYWRDEAYRIGETLSGASVDDCDESIEHDLYAATLDEMVATIESSRASR